MKTEITCATALVWHQRHCKKCRRFAKCAEWWEILTEF